jgi:hypothetical protein
MLTTVAYHQALKAYSRLSQGSLWLSLPYEGNSFSETFTTPEYFSSANDTEA